MPKKFTLDIPDAMVEELEKRRKEYNKRRDKDLSLDAWLALLIHEQASAERLQERVRHVKDDLAQKYQKIAQEEIDATLEAERDKIVKELGG